MGLSFDDSTNIYGNIVLRMLLHAKATNGTKMDGHDLEGEDSMVQIEPNNGCSSVPQPRSAIMFRTILNH